MRGIVVHITCVTLLAACGGSAPPEGGLSIEAMALTLEPLGDASFGLTVKAQGEVVWARAGITSGRYGDGRGAISYVGPCDASVNPHTVELVLESLSDEGGAPLPEASYANPAPAERPLVVEVECAEGRDTPVTFNLTVMRDAAQGFFDVAVTFEDIFCSAKVDCSQELLHDGEARAPTAILAFACAAGADAPTFLHLSDIVLACEGSPALTFDPSGPTGNNGALGVGPVAFQTAIYRGQEALPGVDKCYWNTALGIREDGSAISCRLQAQGTASRASFGPDGLSPADTTFPYVDFDVAITDAEGNLICDNNGLDVAGSGVVTTYTPLAGAGFEHEWECDRVIAPFDTQLGCAGALAGDPHVAVLPSPAGFAVDIGGVRSEPYTLPAGVFVGGGASCCVNPCCDLGGAP